jgi:hypothetical protein
MDFDCIYLVIQSWLNVIVLYRFLKIRSQVLRYKFIVENKSRIGAHSHLEFIVVGNNMDLNSRFYF